MKKFITKCLTLFFTLVSVTVMTETVSAQGIAKPPGTRLVLVSECRIDFESSVSWSGNSEDTILQILWLVSQLPERCAEHSCIFTNINPDWFLLLIPRFLEKFENDPRLKQLGSLVITAFDNCRIAANPRQSLVTGSATLSCGSDGNTLILSISGSNNVFSASQTGCNTSNIQMNGSNITVRINQRGRNEAVVSINGNNIVFILEQYGQNSYHSTITSPGTYHIRQDDK